MTAKRKTMARKTTAPTVNEAERRRIADVRFADQIDALKDRCSGLEMAIIGAGHVTGGELNGVSRLAADIAQGLGELAIAFAGDSLMRPGVRGLNRT